MTDTERQKLVNTLREILDRLPKHNETEPKRGNAVPPCETYRVPGHTRVKDFERLIDRIEAEGWPFPETIGYPEIK
jgi:hypothetical protein